MMNRSWFAAAMAASLLAACSGGNSTTSDNGDAATADDASGGSDTGTTTHDGSVADHAAAGDAFVGVDSSSGDAGAGDASLDSSAVDSSALDSAADTAPPPPDAAVECGAPAVLHPQGPDAGPYCPFSTAAPPFSTCAHGEHCCEPPAGMGTLSTCASSCPNLADGGTDWQCEDPISCPTGQLCCAVTTGYDPNVACGYGLLHGFRATVCATSCGAGQIRVCESNVECPVGTTCQVVKAKGANFGVCQ